MDSITTQRLIIRRPNVLDLQDFLAYRNDAENLKMQPIQPMTEQEAITFLQEQANIKDEQARGWIMFAIELRAEKRMIGEVGIYIPAENDKIGDMGWSVNKDYQRKGYAIEAVGVLLQYAFGVRGMQQVTATCDAANTASLKLMQGLGMSPEANFVNNQPGKGEYPKQQRYILYP